MAAKSVNKSLPKISNFPVAGVGASAGGLDAFKTLIKAIPDNSGIAWVLVQHQHPTYESMLTDLLQKVTAIQVKEITNNLVIKPNNIYVLPANKMLKIEEGKLKLTPRSTDKTLINYPINLFFESLALVYQENAIGIILSGTASDGTKGLKAIKDHGGITMCQTVASAAYAGMPESAIAAGVVDFILAPDKMPKKLLDIKKVISIDATDEKLPEQDENSFKEILSLLHIHKSMDFTFYKQTTIRRRILRRMVLNKYKKIADYTSCLKENKAEINALYQDMLIPVTNFFRDEKTFNNLCDGVFPNIIKNKQADGNIRIWVAGCSTGEEAYSIAICFKEYLGIKNEKIQIFATDLSEPAIAKARAGIYSKAEADAVSHHRLKNFFTYVKGNYQVNKDLRDMCVFATHNFLKDPPFGKIDFISCRNVLIYMDTYLQKKALATFHYALNSKGLLILGKSENTIGITDLFISNNKSEKIFTRKNVPSKLGPVASKQANRIAASEEKKIKLPESIRTDFYKMADDVMLRKYTPAAVVVNEAMDIVHFRGNTGAYLQQSPGKPTHSLLKMAKIGLAFELRNIIHKTIKQKKAVKKENIPVQLNGVQQFINLEAIPLTGLIEPHYLLIFNDSVKIISSKVSKSPARNKKDEDALRLQQLEQELAQLREDMRSITEEQEASNEQLQGSNEELQSTNEELQSLNEELETSKEELQSTVEELTVVNHEMLHLNEQLNAEKEYADAIIGTVPQPMLILDKNLRVVIANQLFYQHFLVNEGQTEGRLVYDIGNRQWDIPELRQLLEAILPEKESFLGFEVEHDFKKIGKRIMRLNAREILREKPEKRILLVIEDVTDYVEAARKIAETEHRYANMIYSSPFMIAILEGKDMIIKNANDAILATWDKGKDIIGKSLLDVLPQVRERGSDKIIKAVFETGEPYYGYEVPVEIIQDDKKETAYYTYIYQAQKDLSGKIEGVAILAHEVTSQALLNRKIKETSEEFSNLADNISQFAWMADDKGWIYWYNQRWYDYTGTTLEEMQGWGWQKVHHPDHIERVVKKIQHSWDTGEIWEDTFPLKSKEGAYRWFLSRALPIKDTDGKIVRWFGTNTDITEQKLAEEQFRLLADQAPMWVWLTDTALNILYANTELLKFIGIAEYKYFTGHVWEQKVHPDELPLIYSTFEQAALAQKPFEVECRIQNAATNVYEWFFIKGVPRFEANEFTGFIGTAININEQKSALNQLEYRKALLEAHNEASLDGILLVDTKGKIISYNHRFIEIWNMPKHITDANDDEAALTFATTQLIYPDQFIEKVKWLYDHPDEISIDELEFTDGKIIERHGYPVTAPDGSYYAWSWMFRDITAQKKSEATIKESAAQLQKTTEHFEIATTAAEVGIWSLDIASETLIWSDLHKKMWGYNYQQKDLTYEDWHKLIVAEDKEMAFAQVAKALKTKTLYEVSYRIKRADDGDMRWIHSSGQYFYNDAGEAVTLTGVSIDITVQKEAELALKESQERYHNLIISSPSAIGVLKGEDLVITTANDAIIKIWGKGRAVMGKKYFEALPELAEQGYKEIFAEVYKTGVPFNAIETPVNILQDGKMTLKYYNFLLYAQKNAHEQIDGIGIIATEVTLQALLNRQVQDSEKRFRLLADSMPQHVWTADAEGNLNYFNQSVFDYSGLSLEQINKDGWLQIVHPDDREENIKQWTASVTTGKDFLFEHRFKRYDGGYRWQLSRALPQRDNEGYITMWVGASTDIQNLKEEEQRKTDFIKMVSHELKTPVTSIKGYVQMLLSMLDDTGEKDMNAIPIKSSLTRVDEQIKRLTRLITEMLDLSKLEESKLHLKKETLVLNDLVKETVQDIGFTNKTHNISIKHLFTGSVYVDKDRIQQVIINLVNNGIKYSPQKQHIEVSIEQKIPGTIDVSIKDFGIGINEQEQEKIFNRFYRAEGKVEYTFGGFGIGLYITKEILAKHNGTIKVESMVDIGSVFTFTLPLSP
jgi:two-component system, chemotaxis family, CheB/CheR fusion protein